MVKKGFKLIKKGQKGGKVKLKSSLKLGEINSKIINYNIKTPQTAQKTANYSKQLMASNVLYAARFIRHYPDGRNLNLKGFYWSIQTKDKNNKRRTKSNE